MLLAACVRQEAARGKPDPKSGLRIVAVSRYDCGLAGRLIIKWAKDAAEVSFGEMTQRLPRALSGSGARYSDGTSEVWEHQGVVRWTGDGARPRTCRPITGK